MQLLSNKVRFPSHFVHKLGPKEHERQFDELHPMHSIRVASSYVEEGQEAIHDELNRKRPLHERH